MKKLISITLAVIMVLAACPLTLFAAATSTAASDAQITTGVASIWYNKDGVNTEYGKYDTLDAAVDALGALYTAAGTVTDGDDADTTIANELYAAAGSPVIKLNGNFQATTVIAPSWFNGSNDTDYTVVIDGAKSTTENYTVTFGTEDATWNGYAFEDMAYYNSVFKNVNFVIERGASTTDGFFHGGGSWQSADFDQANITFENCVIDENSTLVGTAATGSEGGLFKLNGRPTSSTTTDKYNLTFKDCTVDASTAISIQVLWFADADINFVNTTWTLSGTAGKASNNSIVKAMRCGKVNVNVDGTSKLIAARSEGCTSVAILLDGNAGAVEPVGDITYNLAAGAELTLNNTGATNLTKRGFIFNECTGVNVVINDNGAIFKASANDVKNGVTLPTLVDGNGKTRIWKVNGTAVGSYYKDASATGTTTFSYNSFSTTDTIALMNSSGTIFAGYTDLVEAVKAARSTDTILVVGNITTGKIGVTSYDPKHVKDVTIIGIKRADGTFPTVTANGGFSWGTSLYNLTVKNLNINATGTYDAVFNYAPQLLDGTWMGEHVGSTTTIENVIAKSVGSSGTRFMFKTKGHKGGDDMATLSKQGRFYINASKSTFEVTNADNFMLNNSAAQTYLTFTDCNLTHTNSGGNGHMFNINTQGLSKIIFAGTCNVTFNHNSSGNYSYFFNNGGNGNGTVVIDLSDKTTLNWNTNQTTKTDNRLAPATVIVNNFGAKFNIAANIATKGFFLPINFYNGTVGTYTDGTNNYTGGNLDANKITGTGAMTITPSATANPAASGMVCVNVTKDTFYATLDAAISAAADNADIVVFADTNTTTILSKGNMDIAVIGAAKADKNDKYMLTQTASDYIWQIGGNATKLVISDLDITFNAKGIWMKAAANILDNCNITTTGNYMVARPAGSYDHEIDFVDTTWTSNSKEPIFVATADNSGKGEQNLDINLINSHLIKNCAWNDNHRGNTSVFYTRTNGLVDISVDETSSITLAPISTVTPTFSQIINYEAIQHSDKMELDFTLEEGAVINVKLPAVKTEFTAVYYGGVKSVPTNFVDKGAKWNITTASATTLNLPLVFDNDGNPKEWKLNSATIASTSKTTAGATNVYTNESTTLANHSEIKGYTELYGNGRKYFTSLQTAVNDLGSLYYYTGAATDDALWTAAGTPTIYVVNDFTSASEILPSWYLAYGNNAYSASKVPTVIIKGVGADGSRVKITTTNEGSFIGGNAYYNLTLEDIDIECTNGFALFWRGYNTKVITVNEENVTVGQNSGKSTTNMINCNIKATGTKVATGKLNEGLVFKVTGNQNQTKTENYIINMIGTNVETTFETNETVDTGVNAVFLFHHGAAGELNIDGNSSIIHNQNRAGAGGDTMFNLATIRKFVVNIKNGAELTANITKTNGNNRYAIITCDNSNTYASADGIKNDITIEDGVIININADDAFNNPIYVIDHNLQTSKAKSVMNLGTVTLNLNAKAQELGVTFYTGVDTENGRVLGLSTADGKLYGNVVKAATLTAKPVYFTSGDFNMVTGAAIRSQFGSGIRFQTNVSTELKTLLNSANAVQFGTLISNITDAAPTLETAAASLVNIKQSLWANESKTLYSAALINIPDNATAYQVKMAGRGYFTVTYADGSTATFYTDFSADNNVRSMYDVATSLKEMHTAGTVSLDENQLKAIDTIIEVVTTPAA